MTARYVDVAPQDKLAAVQRLCDTEEARRESIGAKTSSEDVGKAAAASSRLH
jgi:hypothetical protein